MAFLFLAILFPLAVFFLIVALRGRRVDDHPLCRRCRFDLTGRPPSSTRCPECGTDLSYPRAVVIGHRAARPRARAAAVALFAGCLLVIPFAYDRTLYTRSLRHQPQFLLRFQALHGPTRQVPAIAAELGRRLAAGALTDADVAAVMDVTYAMQSHGVWYSSWGDLVDAARARGLVDDDRWRRYTRNALARPPFVYTQPNLVIPVGDPIPVEASFALTTGSRTPVVIHAGASVAPVGQTPAAPSMTAIVARGMGRALFRCDLPLGPHPAGATRLVARVDYEIHDDLGIADRGSVTREILIDLVPANPADRDVALHDLLASRLAVGVTGGAASRPGQVMVYVGYQDLPVSADLDVYVRIAGRECFIFTERFSAKTNRGVMGYGLDIGAAAGATTADVILRPSVRTPDLGTARQFYRGPDIVFPNVPISPPAGTFTPTSRPFLPAASAPAPTTKPR